MTKPLTASLKLTVTAFVLALGTGLASAHPGHDLRSESVNHLLTSPYHLITLTALGATLLVGAAFVKKIAARRTMQISGAAVLIASAFTTAIQFLS